MPGTRKNFPSKTRARKFAGNRYTALAAGEVDASSTGATAKKMRLDENCTVSSDGSIFYVVMAFTTVFGQLSKILKCKKCNSDVLFQKSEMCGLGFQLHVICECSEEKIDSCPKINNGGGVGRKAWEVNRKFVFVMRLLGVGIQGINMFCGMMDICSGFSNSGFYGIMEHIRIAVKTIYDKSLHRAAESEQELLRNLGRTEDSLSVSGDGTWSKRGYSSLLGVITLIGKQTGKVLDLIVKSRFCMSCKKMIKKLSKEDFQVWYDEHAPDCSSNHSGSAGKMEVDGVIEMFERSMDLHNVRYLEYIGDGDSKTFSNLAEKNIYGDDFPVQKLECVLHVGKRMYKRLKDAKKKVTMEKKLRKDQEKKAAEEVAKNSTEAPSTEQTDQPDISSTPGSSNSNPVGKKNAHPKKVVAKKVKKTPASKPASKKGPKKTHAEPKDPVANFTDKIIREMSTFYALAIQRHPDSLDDMYNEVWAGFYHKISTDEHPQHDFCNYEWCKYVQHAAAGEDYEHPPPLDPEVQEIVKEVYTSLSDKKLLERCLGKNNQNNNECFNSCLWQLAPKHMYVGKNILEVASWITSCVFNDGLKSLLLILKCMNVRVGDIAVQLCNRVDKNRLQQSTRKSSEGTKQGRIQKKKDDQELQNQISEVEGILYGPGIE